MDNEPQPGVADRKIAVLTWNLNAFTNGRTAEKIDLLERLEWDVAALQELLPSSIDELRARFPKCELVTREPNETWPKPGIRRRAAVLVRPSVEFVSSVLVDCDGDQGIAGVESPAPREAIAAAEIDVRGRRLTIVSAHPPHASGRDDHEREWRLLGKLRTYAALTRWISTRDQVVLAMDSNAWLDEQAFEPPVWKDTHPQASVMRFFFADPPEHGLRDAFRVWLSEHPSDLADIRRRRPQGPLALTHVRGGNRPIGDRFDVILIPPSLRVSAIEHNYEDAIAAGSDHAYVRGELAFDQT